MLEFVHFGYRGGSGSALGLHAGMRMVVQLKDCFLSLACMIEAGVSRAGART